ncbi:prephenate dehydratase [Longispora albida]|uniref:prephenate dehydratase n=1 Tax=Longispora albida TaxID=203523 RepID=UPI0003A94E7E|nr:prephenate dehydratase [Longispora albida]
MKYAYLGPAGTFTEAALRTFAGDGDELVPCRSVPEALEVVRLGTADAALVPVENSVGGGVDVTLDELVAGSPLEIIREVLIPVTFVFVGDEAPDRVGAHPQASAQCRRWLAKHHPDAVVVDMLSNAAAALSVRSGEIPAAITSPIAAQQLGLTPVHSDIGDQAATTRFVLVAPPGTGPGATGNDLTTLAVYIAHDQVGALLQVLTELASRGVNLTRIESRPTGEALGRYVFFLDCEGHISDRPIAEAFGALERFCAKVTFLGSYVSGGR